MSLFATRLLLVTFLAISPPALADWVNKNGGVSFPDTDARKSKDSFSAEIVLVEDDQALFADWLSSSTSVKINAVNNVRVGKGISAFILFSGCKTDAAGNCNVTMQFRVIRPDGEVYGESTEMEVWQNRPAPKSKSIELSIRYMKIIIEPKDQVGKYVIDASVKDKNAGTTLQLKAAFTATKQ